MKRGQVVQLRRPVPAAPPPTPEELPPMPPEMLEEVAEVLAALVLEKIRRQPARP